MPSRVRTDGQILDTTHTYTTTTFSGAVSSSTSMPDTLKVGSFKTTTDVVTPKFHSRVARGEIINNPFMSIQEDRYQFWSGHTIQTNSGSGSTIKTRDYSHYYIDLVSFPGSPWGHLEGLRSELIAACTQAAASVDSDDVDGWVETMEGRQTIDLFDRRSWSLRNQIAREEAFNARKGFGKYSTSGMSIYGSVFANNWLRYRYGIAPFLRLLNDTLVKGTSILTRRRTSRGEGSLSDTWATSYPGGGYYHPNSVWTETGSAFASARAGILYEYVRFGNKYGFNLDDLPLGFWNVVPWSFVVDWFVNAGEFIGAMTPKLNVRRLATWHGYHAEITRVLTIEPGAVRSGFTVTKDCSGGSSTQRVTVKRRTPGLLSPALVAREGAMRELINSRRLVDAVALTWQAMKMLMSSKIPPRRGRVPVRYIGQ